MTVEKAVLNILSCDFVPGLSYVAVSRVKTLRGILFEEPFDYERFRARQNETVRSRNADRERRANQHISSSSSVFPSSPLRRLIVEA